MQHPQGGNYGYPQNYPPAPQPTKEPSTGLLLELIGFLGISGIGWLWAGETAIGLLLLFGYWVFIVVEILLMAVLIGFCLIPLNFIIPIASALILQNRLKARQAAYATQYNAPQQPGSGYPF